MAANLQSGPSGYFIPNIRRENFAVYENGIRQHNPTVEIEHARVSLGLLLEHGGRYPFLNKAVADEVSRAALRMLGDLGREDKVAVGRDHDHPGQVPQPKMKIPNIRKI